MGAKNVTPDLETARGNRTYAAFLLHIKTINELTGYFDIIDNEI